MALTKPPIDLLKPIPANSVDETYLTVVNSNLTKALNLRPNANDSMYVTSAEFDPETGILILRQGNGVDTLPDVIVGGFLTMGIKSNTMIGDGDQRKYKGPKGYKGPPGKDGKDGRDGRNGIQGIMGCPGVIGDTGQRGLEGYQGTQGERGDVGEPGPKGDKGERGSYGLRGLKGNGSRKSYNTKVPIYESDGITQKTALVFEADNVTPVYKADGVTQKTRLLYENYKVDNCGNRADTTKEYALDGRLGQHGNPGHIGIVGVNFELITVCNGNLILVTDQKTFSVPLCDTPYGPEVIVAGPYLAKAPTPAPAPAPAPAPVPTPSPSPTTTTTTETVPSPTTTTTTSSTCKGAWRKVPAPTNVAAIKSTIADWATKYGTRNVLDQRTYLMTLLAEEVTYTDYSVSTIVTDYIEIFNDAGNRVSLEGGPSTSTISGGLVWKGTSIPFVEIEPATALIVKSLAGNWIGYGYYVPDYKFQLDIFNPNHYTGTNPVPYGKLSYTPSPNYEYGLETDSMFIRTFPNRDSVLIGSSAVKNIRVYKSSDTNTVVQGGSGSLLLDYADLCINASSNANYFHAGNAWQVDGDEIMYAIYWDRYCVRPQDGTVAYD